ncbi:prolipoprotein diacylglyceryl transferase [Occallatibacter savannae]|uniref:prolipoprotein diacylglyceryl transferase n=1 Tax=Occallatibacter savannae TaxID=1002691 RepID=UPI000D6877B3|nr:prolipoprotein diacylglyceryl transferase family protein [Occallatibacter savannae]
MIPIGSHPLWHPIFETLAYASGYAAFRRARERQGDIIPESQRWTVIAAAAVGALLGSRILGIAEQWPTALSAFRSGHIIALLFTPGGKTIVGGLLGGWLGVEIAKRVSGIQSRTGDLFVIPLCLGIAVGRVGCFVAGLSDDTFGKPTQLPWAVDFGDGIGRHPTQLYEIIFLAILAFALSRLAFLPNGQRFRIFLAAYLGWRIVIDFFKPQPLVGGMNVIQWACASGLAALAVFFLNDLRNLRGRASNDAAIA